MILDNADDPGVFFDPYGGMGSTANYTFVVEALSLSAFLPQSGNGSILVTSRNEDTAYKLTENIIKIGPMDEDHALALLRKKLGGESDREDAVGLVRALDHMPLAITQAAAFIKRSARRMTVSKYVRHVRPSAAHLLSLMSFFYPQGIPEALLLHHGDNNADIDGNREGDTDRDFEDDIFTLTDFFLITTNVFRGVT